MALFLTPDKSAPIEKRGRGRPSIMNMPDNLPGMIGLPDVHGRQRANHFYSWHATALLGDDERLAWLFDGPGGKPRTGVLAELGRIKNYTDRLAMALEVCNRKMKSKDAETWIRSFRRGKPAKASADALAGRLVEAINAYASAHPGTTPVMIREALRSVTISGES